MKTLGEWVAGFEFLRERGSKKHCVSEEECCVKRKHMNGLYTDPGHRLEEIARAEEKVMGQQPAGSFHSCELVTYYDRRITFAIAAAI